MMQSDDDQWLCPSFNSYSLNKSAETAAKVAGEFTGEVAGEVAGDVQLTSIAETEDRSCNEEDDFEFALILSDEFEVSGCEMIRNFPVFDREFGNDFESKNQKSSPEKVDMVPLGRLFIEERENEEPPSPSSSSSEAEEAEEVASLPPGRYCVWKPKVAAAASPSTCKKSKSTGFGSTRWKLRDLLRRSNSEGKDSFVFLTPSSKKDTVKKNSGTGLSKAAKALISSKKSSSSGSGSVMASPARRMTYSPANRDMIDRGNRTPNRTPNRSPTRNGEMPKRKSYLPYRQDLVGFFTTVNSIGRSFSPL